MADEPHTSLSRHRLLLGRELKYRLLWLVRLRYGTALGVLLVTMLLEPVLGVVVQRAPLLLLDAILLGYNVVMHLVVMRKRFANWYDAGYKIAIIQILLDVVLLTGIIHVTGGLDNPAVFFFVFHAIIAAILLSRRAAYAQATVVVGLLTIMVALEQLGVLHHYHMAGYQPHVSDIGSSAIVLGAVAATLYLSVYMTSSIARELRAREESCLSVNDRLVDQDRLRSEYVNLIAHDLKDPLASIQSTLQVVLGGYVGEVPERARGLIERADARAAGLIRTIGEMLDLSRMRNQAELERTEWDYQDMVRDVVDSLTPKAVEKRQDVVLELPERPLTIYANRMALEQVIVNLVGNAIKYTPDEGRVIVRVWESGERIRTLVGDTGIGVPEASLSRVFDEFYRAPNAKKATRDGTGMGLAFVRQIISAYGGLVKAESPWTPHDGASALGTVFTFCLPWERVRPPSASKISDPSPAENIHTV